MVNDDLESGSEQDVDREEAYRETAAYVEADSSAPEYMEQTAAVVDEFEDRMRQVENPLEAQKEFTAVGDVLAEIADESEDPSWVIEYVDKKVRSVSQATGNQYDDDTIKSGILPPVREIRREHEEEKLSELASDPDHTYTVDRDDAIGIDEYIEQYLDRVVQQVTTDYDTDPEYHLEFKDGTIVEFDELDHRSYAEFQKQVSAAASMRVLNKIASRKALEDIESDIETDYAQDKYRELSHGPEERPWGLDQVDWWNEVITSLEDEAVEDPAIGPNEDALFDLENAIRRADAALDLQSVVDAGDRAVHYNEEKDEVWVPNHMIDNAWEDYATTRSSFRKELSERGVLSDELSGDKAVEVVFSTDPPQRFWRLDASHERVPELDPVEEIERGATGFAAAAGYSESVQAATDGGPEVDADGDGEAEVEGKGGDE